MIVIAFSSVLVQECNDNIFMSPTLSHLKDILVNDQGNIRQTHAVCNPVKTRTNLHFVLSSIDNENESNEHLM